MRFTWAMLASIMAGCTPESHALLSSATDAGGVPSNGPSSWSDCMEAKDDGSMGDRCSFTDACGGPAAAQCHRGELLISTAAREGVAGDCAGDVQSTAHFEFVATGRPDVGCLSGVRCDGGPFTLCQVDPRPAVRSDAGDPFATCETALRTGRDGDACGGDFACGASDVAGHPLIAWCDGGILRLASVYGVAALP